MLFALFKRHFASRLSPDPMIVDDFKEFCGIKLKKLVKEINKLPLPDFITVDDWLQQKTWTETKKTKYKNVMLK